MTEPGAGSDLQAMRTRAVRDGDDYVVNGAKTFITNGCLADLLIVAVQDRPGAGARRHLAAGRRDARRPGRASGAAGCWTRSACTRKDTAELFFDDVRVPAANLLGGSRGLGLRPADAAAAAGAAGHRRRRGGRAWSGAVELTVAYVKERTAFGKPLIGHQNTRFELAECADPDPGRRVFLDDCIVQHIARRAGRADRGDGQVLAAPRGSARSSTSACSCSAATAT